MDSLDWIANARAQYLKEAVIFLCARGLITGSDSVVSLIERWPSYVEDLFSADNPEQFYRQWHGAVGASNLLTNIVDQFGRSYIVDALRIFFASPYAFTGTMLDFGCGTAALSLNWQWSFAPHARLLLADVENLPREFVRHEIAKHPECVAELHDVSLEQVPDRCVDVTLCIDVLEHLPNPSEVFALLHRKIRSGGLLFLQAPWGGHPEHLENAQDDWNTNGGSRRLDQDYNRLVQIHEGLLSGVYLKKCLD